MLLFSVYTYFFPLSSRLSRLPGCFFVSILAIPVDVPLITAVALWKSPYMLFRGWKRLLEDMIGREGPFLETVCVPFAALAIILWPLAVLGSFLASFLSSFFLGLYAGVIVYQVYLRFISLVRDLIANVNQYLGHIFPGRFSSDGICIHCVSDFFV